MMRSLIVALLILHAGCNMFRTDFESVAPGEFDKLMMAAGDFIILDVRTPEEFEESHLEEALNMDFYAPDFKEQINAIERGKEVFVYCLAGGRSSEAAKLLSKKGHKVTELKGGICAWKKSNLPIVSGASNRAQVPLGKDELFRSLDSNRLYLINFTATWCLPCRKLAPVLANIDSAYGGKVILHKIDYDTHQQLISELKVKNVPFLLLVENGKILWSEEGLLTEKELRAIIDARLN